MNIVGALILGWATGTISTLIMLHLIEKHELVPRLLIKVCQQRGHTWQIVYDEDVMWGQCVRCNEDWHVEVT